MNTSQLLLAAAVLVLLGAALGAWAAAQLVRRRVADTQRRTLEALEHKHLAALGQARSAQARAQAELEQTRNSFKRQLLAASSEPRAELARINGRLQIAYAELDRLRMQLDGAVTAPHPDLPDGFAATQPMPQSMPPRR
jgi:K+-sensing histidine kinase KdpD